MVPELAGGEQNGMSEALDRLEIVDPDHTAQLHHGINAGPGIASSVGCTWRCEMHNMIPVV